VFEEPCATGEEDKQGEEPKLGFETFELEEGCGQTGGGALRAACFSCFWLEML